LLWDADAPTSAPHKVSECYNAVNPTDARYAPITFVPGMAQGNADSAVDLMTVNSHLRSTKGVVFDVP
jgi:hypothetical protein